ncbi:hypothetical protein MVLG_01574 [Microbotryum lychnidis-dioicae p1A1 Lamole]|uniref:Uncharacterized protein n=1 Tax=Microbotryum lychnidis-dioicae (strain p1A1 Lamole / MvSl-1064) TaxID=683840 RepID=U5H2I9_USTV1|nr:hypothetical protein MVLG_01574 [Microbotryum lychnidis-dioicae p1A1 Lamole]|eukprot:KDE08312.1 hypothetical protein MVLG_01574 [Microbotryum lychnidis-dioicae p1A1 Lamole]
MKMTTLRIVGSVARRRQTCAPSAPCRTRPNGVEDLLDRECCVMAVVYAQPSGPRSGRVKVSVPSVVMSRSGMNFGPSGPNVSRLPPRISTYRKERWREFERQGKGLNKPLQPRLHRMQKSRKRSGSRSVSAHPEREAAAGLMGLRRASLGNEWPDRSNRSPMGLSSFVSALQHPSGPPMMPPSPPLTTRPSSTPHFSPPSTMMMTPRASSDYGSRRGSLTIPSQQFMEHRQLQYLPPITQMIPPQYFQGVPPAAPPAPSDLPNLNRRPSFLEAWRQRTHGAPLPSLAQQVPPISTPSSSVRSTMTDPQTPSLEHEHPEQLPHD